MSTISVSRSMHILKDGADLGHIIDVIRSNPCPVDAVEAKAAMDVALIEFYKFHEDGANAAAQAIADLKRDHDAQLAERDAKIALLGGETLAAEKARLKEMEELQAVFVAAGRRLQELKAVSAEPMPTDAVATSTPESRA